MSKVKCLINFLQYCNLFIFGIKLKTMKERLFKRGQVRMTCLAVFTVIMTTLSAQPSMNRHLIEKHYSRKHGPDAYYGQKK